MIMEAEADCWLTAVGGWKDRHLHTHTNTFVRSVNGWLIKLPAVENFYIIHGRNDCFGEF